MDISKTCNDCPLVIDLVSDLHIDQWSPLFKNRYPCGEIKDFPFEIKDSDSKYLIIAGDISDDINVSIEYLNKISEKYEKILFVDGNHEHVNAYPDLYTKEEINKLINNEKIVYLSNNPYIVNKTVFLGCCGWWDYNNFDKSETELGTKYFKDWISHFSRKKNIDFMMKVIPRSCEEIMNLIKLVEKYESDETINQIVIVTHTVPKKDYCYFGGDNDSVGTQYNTKYKMVLKKANKITHWLFGHAHNQTDEYDEINKINYISHPRGRPEDYNRITYDVKKIVL